MRTKFPTSVDFMLLGSCNLKCPFCFGPKHETPPIKTDKAVKILDKLASNGVEKIVFTGGEPTLINDLPFILLAAKRMNFTTVLSTNGLLLASNKKLLDKIALELNWIALPLDSSTQEGNGPMRVGIEANLGIKHFKAVIGLIRTIRENYPDLKIKLGTVLTQLNLEHIENIPDLLVSRNAVPDTWKLYQISPSEYGKANYPSLKIEDKEFRDVYERSQAKALKVGIPNVVKYTNEDRAGKYFFINPKGDVMVIHPRTNDYYQIGNIMKNFKTVTKEWNIHINAQALSENFDTTYPNIPAK